MRKNLKTFFSIVSIGLLSGAFSGLFLLFLDEVTRFRVSHSWVIFLLPLFGLFYIQVLNRLPKEMGHGVSHILKLRNSSPWLAPFVFIGSLGTHLFGGSAGREGVGVIMGASTAHLFKEDESLKSLLVPIGIASGFSAIFGTPLAGVIFALELEKFSSLNLKKVIFLLISSFIAFFVSGLIAHHTIYPPVEFKWSLDLLGYVLISSLAVGILGFLFLKILRGIEKLKLNIFWLSLLIVGIIFIFHAEEYAGIGLDLLQRSFLEDLGIRALILKFILTVLTLGAGYKGGEVTPLFIMGSNFSTYLSLKMGLNHIALSGGLGMLGLFGALANAPFAAGVMALEIFNWQMALLVFITALLGKFILNKKSIYH